MPKEAKIVEYWETEALPSMKKNSPEFHDALDNRLTQDALLELNMHPFLSRDEIETSQFGRIKELVRIAYNNTEFYKAKYTDVGAEPEDIKTWEDYHNLPITTKDELIDAFPHGTVNSDFEHSELFPTRSSGSSGKTLRIYVDPEAIMVDTLQGIRQFWLQTGRTYGPNDTIAHVYTVPWWTDHFRENEYQNIFVSSLIEPERISRILEKVQPEVLSLYPSNLASLLPFLEKGKLRSLRTIVTHSEMSSRAERETYSQRLGVPVLDEYSSEEMTRMALELPDGKYYICEDTVRLDVVDPDINQPIEQGTGMVVGTNLLNEAMPFIRYAQGDFITIGQQQKSEISWRQLEQVEGRRNDSFIRTDGAEVPAGTILDITYRWMFDIGINIQSFEIIQTSPYEVKAYVYEPRMEGNNIMFEKSSDHLSELLHYVLGNDVHIQVETVENVSYFDTNGKKRRPIRRGF